ncbi:MAG: sigA 2 [Mucilaginibacter sp.]|uniref:sigma-70 family RNA polymerase sigma factor n=1 Tax=Mucilaginibacter sp. TaxID=1882438 RepID=UPI002627CD0F|nr:sigma-70 family RNA polymerase sigma factor [Mucilaginibacter sp.]MDB5004417.1 sigA 2 [Mucilaginibacter sp.]
MRELQIGQSITNEETRSVAAYFNEVGKLGLLTQEEEVALARRIKAGDKVALDRLVCTNLRFVVSVAKKYQHQGLPLADLISEGNLGLIQAALKFDESRGFKFISYAVWWIRQSMLAAISEQSRIIRLPQNLVNVLTKTNKAAACWEQQQERQPTTEELAGFMKENPVHVADALYFAPNTTSYDATYNLDNEAYGPLDRTACTDAPADQLIQKLMIAQELEELLTRLTEQESEVLKLTYGLCGEMEQTPATIAELIGMSIPSVHYIRKRALEKLRLEPAAQELAKLNS